MAEREDDLPRDPGSLVMPPAGALSETSDPCEPYWLAGPDGMRAEAVPEFLRDLQAAGRRATTQRPGHARLPGHRRARHRRASGSMTGPRRRKNAIVLPIPQAAELTALLATLDEFIRSSPRITAQLAAFLASRGAPFPGFHAGNLIDELSFTALGFRQLLAASEDAGHQESPCHHPTR